MKKIGAVILALLLLGLVFYFYQNNPAHSNTIYSKCFVNNVTGFNCPGCGGQRALHALLHFNFKQAAQLNVFIFIFIPLLGYLFLKAILAPFQVQLPDLSPSYKSIIIILVLLIVFTIIRNLPYYPFTLLKS